MKILISTDTVGGVLTYTTELATALEAGGDEVAVATMGPPLRRAQREALPPRIHESGCRLEWMEDPWEDVVAAGEWLLRLEEDERPDVVHLCSYAHAALPFEAPKVVVAHSDVLSWWRAVHDTEAPQSWNRYREEVSAGLQEADAVVAPTAAMLLALEQDHDLDPERTQVIPNGTAFPARGRGTPPELHQISSLVGGEFDAVRDGELFVLGSGRFWDEAKNLAVLDTAAEGLNWPVVVAGDLGRPGPPGSSTPLRWRRCDRPRRSTRRPASTSRSGWGSSRRLAIAARWSSATYPRCGSSGRTRRSSSTRAIRQRCVKSSPA
jgi:glycosyltransferase involved in cell wall biosynthesis